MEKFRKVEMDWLAEHREELQREHAGQWVGVDPEGLVASAPSLKELMELCKREDRDTLVLGILEVNQQLPFFGGV